MMPKYGLVLPTEKSKLNRGKKKQKFVRMPHVVTSSINVNWEIQQAACFANQHVLSDMLQPMPEWIIQHVGIGSTRFSIFMYEEELFTQFFCLWTMIQGILRHFKGRMLWCVILLPM